MRRTIQEYLAEQCPSFEGRFYYPDDPDANTEKPYAVIKFNIDSKKESGRKKRFELWLYVEPGDWETLDSLVAEVETALNDQIVGDSNHVYSDGRGTPDFPDDELRASAVRVDFHYYG